MKTTVYVSVIVFLLMLVTACEITGPESTSSGHDGKAAVHVRIGQEDAVPARTVRPPVALTDVGTWQLWGRKGGAAETLLTEFSTTSHTFYLEPGTWNFTLKGFNKAGAPKLILSGSLSSQVIGSTDVNLTFPVVSAFDGTGTVKIIIELPSGSGITKATVFKDDQEQSTALTPQGDRIVFEETGPAGVYYFGFRLYKGSVLYGVVSELVYVVADLTSEKTFTMTKENLNITYVITYHLGDDEVEYDYYQRTDADTPLETPTRLFFDFEGWYEDSGFSGSAVTTIPAGSTEDKTYYAKWRPFTLAESLAWISANAVSGQTYTIPVSADESLAPHTLDYSGKTVGITLIGDGTERTVSLSSTGSLFTLESGVTLTLGSNVTLAGLTNNDASLVRVNSGGTLVMESGSKITGNTATGYGNGAGVYVDDGGTFEMSGGEISGNTTTSGSGGGVYLWKSTFTMNGGTISDNNADDGGGVFVNTSTFEMSGGEISGNTATNSGGVFVVSGGTFEMSGGKISGNTATNSSGYGGGGGVLVGSGSTSTFTMSGGEISNNHADSDGGGGVRMNGGTFTMSGGEISGNQANSGGGVYVYSGTFTKAENGIIYGSEADAALKNTATSGNGHAVYVDGSKKRNLTAGTGDTLDSSKAGAEGGWIDLVPGSSLQAALTWLESNAVAYGNYKIVVKADESIAPQSLSYSVNPVGITLIGDSTERTVSLSSTGSLFTLETGVTLTLGSNVTLQGRSDNYASLVKVNSGGTLLMGSGSKITGNTNNTNNFGSGVFVAGTFTMSGGEISGNTANFGGGVFVAGTFTMSGGEISGNTVNSGGGGVTVASGTFTMSGGEISGNQANSGGGVSVESATFEMSGGEISGNSAENGGGVSMTSSATFEMSGGEISGNNTNNYGGGVFVVFGTFTKGTNGTIYGSDGGTLKNTTTAGDAHGHAVYLYDGSKKRNTTAGVGVTLDSGTADGWE